MNAVGVRAPPVGADEAGRQHGGAQTVQEQHSLIKILAKHIPSIQLLWNTEELAKKKKKNQTKVRN